MDELDMFTENMKDFIREYGAARMLEVVEDAFCEVRTEAWRKQMDKRRKHKTPEDSRLDAITHALIRI